MSRAKVSRQSVALQYLKLALDARCRICNDAVVNTFQDFVKWAGGTRRAALQLGVSASKVSRIATGKQALSPEIAEGCEAVSHGLFRKEQVLWPDPQDRAA